MGLQKTLESPLACKEFKPVNPKEISCDHSFEGMMLKLQYFGHLRQRDDSFEKTLMSGRIEGKRRRRWQRVRCLDSIINSRDTSLNKLQETVKDQKAWHSAVGRVAKSGTQLTN